MTSLKVDRLKVSADIIIEVETSLASRVLAGDPEAISEIETRLTQGNYSGQGRVAWKLDARLIGPAVPTTNSFEDDN